MSGASSGPGKFRYYVCVSKKGPKARCDQIRSHRQGPLEEAVLEHPGHYSDPDAVRELLEVQGQELDTRDEEELTRVVGRLAESEQSRNPVPGILPGQFGGLAPGEAMAWSFLDASYHVSAATSWVTM